MKTRIIKRTNPMGRIRYVIQQQCFLFRWWVDAWLNSLDGANCKDNFDTLEEAQANLCRFDGTPIKEVVVG